MAFQLLEDRIAVTVDPEAEKKTDSGLVLPDTTNTHEPRYGTVAGVGAGHKSEYTGELVTPNVTVGDRVFFHNLSGETWKIDGTEYRILNVREIIGVDIATDPPTNA